MKSLLPVNKNRFFISGICILVAAFLFSSLQKKGNITPYPFPTLTAFPAIPQNENNPVTIEGAELGKYLFYDSILSRDKTISCASCHKQEFAFSDGGKKFSTGINNQNQRRNTLPLFNLAWYKSLFWDGRAKSIEDQIFFPVRDHSEMDLSWPEAEQRLNESRFYKKKFRQVFGIEKIDSVHIAKAIGQFERTLLSYNSKFDRVLRKEDKLTQAEFRGYEIMNDQSMADCLHCHSTDANALATSLNFSNNGLDEISDPMLYSDFGVGGINRNVKDYGKFKIPSLRNIALTAPYMHDGRFDTLREVIDFYSSGLHLSVNIDSKMTRAKSGGVQLTLSDKICLEEFLNALTDSVFISNPEFSNPFKK